MSLKNFAYLSIRLFGIWMFILSIQHLQMFGNFLLYSNQALQFYQIILLLIPALIYIIVGLCSFLKTKVIITFLVPNDSNLNDSQSNSKDWASLIFSAAGLFIIVQALNPFLSSINSILSRYDYSWSNLEKDEQAIVGLYQILIGGGLELLLGTLIFIGGSRIARWWTEFRNWT